MKPGSPLGWLGIAPGLLMLASGCGKSAADLIPVHGRITFGGSAWPASAHVMFLPKGNAASRPGMAMLDPEGRFDIRTGSRLGLPPGAYSILVECWKNPPKSGLPGKSWIADEDLHGPPEYHEVTISGDKGPVEINFDVPRRQ